MRIKRKFFPVRLLLAVSLAGMTTGVSAQDSQADWNLDIQMGELAVLAPPVRRPIILPDGDDGRRGSVSSRNWQQPSGIQGDFRNLSPSGAGIPPGGGTPSGGTQGGGSVGGASGGTGSISGGSSGGGGGGGSGGNNNGQQGPQIDPPDMGGPEIPTPPIPLPPVLPPLI